MRYLIAIALLLALAPQARAEEVSALSPDGPAEPLKPYKIEVKRDRFRGSATRVLKQVQLTPALEMRAVFTVRDESDLSRSDKTPSLLFLSTTPQLEYKTKQTLNLLLDGDKVKSIPLDDYDSRPEADHVIEFMSTVDLSLADFLAIANAKEVFGEIGKTSFRVSSQQIEGLRELVNGQIDLTKPKDVTESDLPTGPFKHPYEIEVTQSRTPGYTSTILNDVQLTSDLQLAAFFTRNGPIDFPNQTVGLLFISKRSESEYEASHNLELLLDGKRKFIALDYKSTIKSGHIFESMNALMPIADFLDIVNAKVVEGRINTTEFRFKPEQIEAMRDLVSRLRGPAAKTDTISGAK